MATVSKKKCVCGEVLRTTIRYSHWMTCEPFRELCASEIQRIFGSDGIGNSKKWQAERDYRLPATSSIARAWGSWAKFIEWAGADYIAFHCDCGYTTNSSRNAGEHKRGCSVWRNLMINELHRIVGVLGHIPTGQEWNNHRRSGYPHRDTLRLVWGSWEDFTDEFLRNQRSHCRPLYIIEREAIEHQSKHYSISSYRVVGNEVFCMLR